MIKSWRHKGLMEFFREGTRAGVRPDHAAKLKRQLSRLNEARAPSDMNLPGWKLHALGGPLTGRYAVTVNGNWRLTFGFEDEHAILVDYQDYH